MNNRVVHFEIGVEDTERAINFYRNTFNWKIEKWESTDPKMEYWLITTGEKETPGIDGGLFKRENEPEPSKDSQNAANYLCTISIEDIDESIASIKENGGDVITEKMEIPKVGVMAYARDTEGNIFGIMQSDPNAMM